MKASLLISNTVAAFLSASTAYADNPAPFVLDVPGLSGKIQKTPTQRYEILDYSGWSNIALETPNAIAEDFKRAREQSPENFRRGGYSFYYAHLKDHSNGSDILCAGAVTIRTPFSDEELYPEISDTTMYTTSPTIEKLLIPGDYVDENVTQYGSCMSVDANDLVQKDNYIMRPGSTNGLHLPFPGNEPDDFTYEIRDEYISTFWEQQGWNDIMDEWDRAWKNGEMTDTEYGELNNSILNKYLQADKAHLEQQAYGTHNNNMTCEHAGYNDVTISEVLGKRHNNSPIPLCGHLSF